MNILPIRLVETEAEWRQIGESGGRLSSLNVFQSSWILQRDAASFVAGSLDRYGYRLLRNGGTPLLQKSWADWTVEIVIRRHGQHGRGAAPITADIHIHNSRLTEVRERYWRSTLPGVRHVGSVNIGRLICNECFGAVFELEEEDAPSMLARAICDVGLVWINSVTDPVDWDAEDTVRLDPQVTLELLLAYHGWGRAGRYLQGVLGQDPAMSTTVRRYFRRIEKGQLACVATDGMPRNLAVIASSYGLL